jgi:DNA polymerase elongation subunit (family B)
LKTFYTNIYSLGNKINVKSVVNGKREIYKDEYNPVVFVPTQRRSKFKTLDGEVVGSIRPGNISETRSFIERNKKLGLETFGYTEWNHQYIAENFNDCDYDLNLIRICNIDIEVASEHGFPRVEDVREEIVAITLHDSFTNKYYVFGNSEFEIPDDRDDIIYKMARDEEDLIDSFIRLFAEMSPDIITGWNIKFYDIPYLVRRIKSLFGDKYEKKLSPYNYVRERMITMMGREHYTYIISGVSTLDFQDLYKKFTYITQERYSLDHISFVELGTKKLSYDEYDSIHLFYQQDYQRFLEYNIRDVELVGLLEDKLRLIELAISLAYDAGINYEEVFSPVRIWDATIFNHLRKRNIVVPKPQTDVKEEEYEGAYVKVPQIGMHDWIVSFDLNSLYPHLIMQYNISPETVVENERVDVSIDELVAKKKDLSSLKEDDLIMAANGTFYRTDVQGFLPELMQKVYDDRTTAKEKEIELRKENEISSSTELQNKIAKYNNLQMAKKILLNSAYGALANKYFRYYNVKQAEAITMSGQLSIRWIENRLNKYLNNVLKTKEKDYVVASDTDSVYLALGSLVQKFLGSISEKNKIIDVIDTFCEEKIVPYITDCYEDLADYVNAYEQKMFMSREVIADKGIWTAKKRYILNVFDNEGVRYTEPKLKIMGIESVRSSTPSSCRSQIENIMKQIVNTDEDTVINDIEKFKNKFNLMEPEEISFPRSCNNLQNYYCGTSIYKKSTPIHVKGALLYNHFVRENNLDNKYQLIKEGDKIKFIYLKLPNQIKDKVISFMNSLPKEFDLNKHIDYELQFEKTFLDPIKSVLDAIGWKHEKVSDLSAFF